MKDESGLGPIYSGLILAHPTSSGLLRPWRKVRERKDGQQNKLLAEAGARG
jgi:hypothetical protein